MHDTGERENKQQDAKFCFKNRELPFFFRKIAIHIVNVSCQCLQIKIFMSDFGSIYCIILFKIVSLFWMTSGKNSLRISCKKYCKQTLAKSCPCPFKGTCSRFVDVAYNFFLSQTSYTNSIRSFKSDLFTIWRSCLQFLFTPTSYISSIRSS